MDSSAPASPSGPFVAMHPNQHAVMLEQEALLREEGPSRGSFRVGFCWGMLSMLVFLVAVLALSPARVEFGTSLAAVNTDSYTEATTGVVFPASLKPPADVNSEYKILGAGPRIKKIGPIGVKVYGVAMYAEARTAKTALKDYEGKVCRAGRAGPGGTGWWRTGGGSAALGLAACRSRGVGGSGDPGHRERTGIGDNELQTGGRHRT